MIRVLPLTFAIFAAAPAFADCVRISIGSEAAMRAAAESMAGFLRR